ncbi:phosphatase PAP2 family protein [Dactylosporangium fulvum]|uniref:Phosphatase PAP2 family protein n=1 Tax=Dactylosporangium fulvum TaxID=53359 RepID=A0ABY5VUC6_9ACTN|nr:phosphatase PAP2 family protein [Dactylosporangium fulvum]UWP81348.1 phosphatase PAP2 family protein [Dactylosporangium fulvum]
MTITWEEPKATTAPTRVALGRQVAIVTAAVAAYFLVRGATEAATDRALDNARSIVDFERSVGLFHESWLQRTFAGAPEVATFFNWIYIWGHWPVIAVTLIWLARSHPTIYYRTRNAMLLSGGIGLFVFTLFPLAPPRLAELGMVDTVTETSDAYRVLQPAMFTNQYAAMPSLHVGWDLLIGLAIVVAARRPLLKAVGAALPVLMVAAVVLTANHYIVDAIAGATLTTLCWLFFTARQRTPSPRGYAGWDGLRLR